MFAVSLCGFELSTPGRLVEGRTIYAFMNLSWWNVNVYLFIRPPPPVQNMRKLVRGTDRSRVVAYVCLMVCCRWVRPLVEYERVRRARVACWRVILSIPPLFCHLDTHIFLSFSVFFFHHGEGFFAPFFFYGHASGLKRFSFLFPFFAVVLRPFLIASIRPAIQHHLSSDDRVRPFIFTTTTNSIACIAPTYYTHVVYPWHTTYRPPQNPESNHQHSPRHASHNLFFSTITLHSICSPITALSSLVPSSRLASLAIF